MKKGSLLGSLTICLALSAFLVYAFRLVTGYSFLEREAYLLILSSIAILFACVWAAFLADLRDVLQPADKRAAKKRRRAKPAAVPPAAEPPIPDALAEGEEEPIIPVLQSPSSLPAEEWAAAAQQAQEQARRHREEIARRRAAQEQARAAAQKRQQAELAAAKARRKGQSDKTGRWRNQ